MKLTLESSRHLTGPNLYFHSPGTVLDVAVEGVPVDEIVQCWQEEVQKLLAATGWGETPLTVRTSSAGASLAFCSSMDAVYAATELNEAAWNSTVARLIGASPENFEKTVSKLKASIEQESNPPSKLFWIMHTMLLLLRECVISFHVWKLMEKTSV